MKLLRSDLPWSFGTIWNLRRWLPTTKREPWERDDFRKSR